MSFSVSSASEKDWNTSTRCKDSYTFPSWFSLLQANATLNGTWDLINPFGEDSDARLGQASEPVLDLEIYKIER